MLFRPAQILTQAVLAAGFLLCGPPASAQKAAERLADYEIKILNGDPTAAAAFLEDEEAGELAAGGQKAAALSAKAAALKDLADLLAMPWDKTKANKLNQALALRLGADTPLAKVGIGPEPEKLLDWLRKYRPAYPEAKKDAVKNAIRQWDIVFGTMTSVRTMSWGQAAAWNGRGVTVTKDSWAGMLLRERNSVIAQLMRGDQAFLVYDDAARESYGEQLALQKAVNKVKDSGALTQTQLDRLTGRSIADQAYLLGSFFDGGAAKNAPDISRIHAARDSLPKEVLPSEQRALLGGMLGPAILKELAGTAAGKRTLAFYCKEATLKIELRPCDEGYSRYDPAVKTIVLDSETVQQYMRMKGYTTDSVMRSKEQVAEIAKYMSPAVVYESSHQMQEHWAKGLGIYKPRVQEDEIEAMSLEGLYTAEKLAGDPGFRLIMDESREFSSYASKRVAIATRYKKSGSKAFAGTVRQVYFSGLPSLNAAAAQVLGAASDELARRAALPARERERNEGAALTLEEAMGMTPDELAGAAGEIRTDVLAKIERDLTALGVYRDRYGAAERAGRDALINLNAVPAGGPGAPPAL